MYIHWTLDDITLYVGAKLQPALYPNERSNEMHYQVPFVCCHSSEECHAWTPCMPESLKVIILSTRATLGRPVDARTPRRRAYTKAARVGQGDAQMQQQRAYARAACIRQLRRRANAKTMRERQSGVHTPMPHPNVKAARELQGGARTLQRRAYAKRVEWKSGFYSYNNNNNCIQVPLFLFPVQVSNYLYCLDLLILWLAIRLGVSMFTSLCWNIIIAHYFVGNNLTDRQTQKNIGGKIAYHFFNRPIFCFVVDPENCPVQGSYSVISETALYRGALYRGFSVLYIIYIVVILVNRPISTWTKGQRR